MAVERVKDLSDPRLDHYRNIRDYELLRRHGLFVAEGRLIVDRLLDRSVEGPALKSLLLNDGRSSLEDPMSAPLSAGVCLLDRGAASIVG